MNNKSQRVMIDEHKKRMLAFARKQKKVNKLKVTTSENLEEHLQRSLDILARNGKENKDRV
jgi:hypothetical protein